MSVGFLVVLLWALAVGVGSLLLLRNTGWSIFLGVLLAIAVRLLAASYVHYPDSGDAIIYPELAKNLLSGKGLWLPETLPRTGWSDVKAMYPPLYPIVLALAGMLGDLNTATYTAMNTAFDLASAGTIWLIARELNFGKRAVLPAWLFLAYPTAILAVPIAQKESLVLLLVAQVILWVLRSKPVRTGCVTGLLALTQPVLAPLTAVIILALLPARGFAATVRLSLIAAAAASLVMLPWWLRNYLIFGTFVPLTTSMGLSLKVAVEGWYYPLRLGLLDLPEPVRFAQAGREALGTILQNPMPYLKRTILNTGATFLREGRMAHSFGSQNVVSTSVALYWSYYLLLGSALACLFKKPPALLLLVSAAVVAELLIFCVWFEFEQRHRVHLVIPLVLLASWPRERRAARVT